MHVKEIKYKWLFSFGVVFLSFLLANLFLFPLFNSGDDVYLMYILAGGYGGQPTNLLQYNYGWHPMLGWGIKTLFEAAPGINWYTVLLIILQACGYSVIMYVMIRRFQWLTALILYLVVFFFVEIRVLLSLNYTSTAWILATSGVLLLLDESIRHSKGINIFIACLLLLISGLLRLHIVLAVILLFSSCFFVYAWSKNKRWVFALGTVIVLLFALNLQHQQYYRKHIPGWDKQEKIRQSLFYAYNRPIDNTKPWNEIFKDSIERAFYVNHFFYDTSFISTSRIEEIGKALTRSRNFKVKEDYQVLYWVFIEWRVYLLLFSICFFLAWQQGILKKVLQRWCIPAFFVFAAYFYLLLFLKLTEALHMGLLMMLLLYFILAIPGQHLIFKPMAKRFPYSVLLLLLPICWMWIRILEKNQDNRQKNEQFQLIIPEIIKNADKLFIATDDALPLDYFYICDIPANYKITNLINKDRVITHTYIPTLERFGIHDIMKSIYVNPNVFLLGREFPELKQYYKDKYQIAVTITAKLEGYKWLEIRKIFNSSRYLNQ